MHTDYPKYLHPESYFDPISLILILPPPHQNEVWQTLECLARPAPQRVSSALSVVLSSCIVINPLRIPRLDTQGIANSLVYAAVCRFSLTGGCQALAVSTSYGGAT